MERCALVVPCFNEAERLDLPAFTAALNGRPGLRFLFVDDGSRDATLEILRGFERGDPRRISVLPLPENRGKAEAVRAGMARALADGDDLVGFWDADMATPLDALDRFLTVLRDRPEVSVVFGARVQLLGRTIARSPLRHYLGRVFATAASLALSLPVYDTQCGAKLFRNGSETKALFADPFLSRWIFDVEILARLVRARRLEGGRPVAESVYELPLDRWCDVRGSKVKPFDFVRAAGQLARIHARYLRGVRPRAAGAHAAQVRVGAGPAA